MDFITGMQKRYVSYLLRLFKPGSSTGDSWRASLQDTSTLEQIPFDSLPDLFRFLLELTRSDPNNGMLSEPGPPGLPWQVREENQSAPSGPTVLEEPDEDSSKSASE